MAGKLVGPLALQSDLGSIDRKRQLAALLRMRGMRPGQGFMAGAAFTPDLSPLTGMFDVAESDRQFAESDAQERAALGGYEQAQAAATEELLQLQDPNSTATARDEARIVARANAAGVPQEMVQAVMKQRNGGRMLDALNANPFKAAPQGAPQGGGFGFSSPPAGGGGSGTAPVSSPGGGAGSSGEPLGHLSDGQLLVLSTIDNPAQKLAEASLKRRSYDVKDGTLLRGGQPVAPDDPMWKQFASARKQMAGDSADAQEGAKAKRDIVSIDMPDGSKQQLTREDAANYLRGSGPGASAEGRPPPIINMDGMDEAGLERIRKDQERMGVRPPAFGFGRSQTPAGKVTQEEEARTEALKRRGQVVPQFEPGSRQYLTAPTDENPKGTAVNPEGIRPAEPPASIRQQLAQNEVTIAKIRQAIPLVQANPDAFGVKNMLIPDAAMQRLDPEGVKARAMIADIGGQKIHDRSGAAVTIGEAVRLIPYIPSAKDSPAAVIEKLNLFLAEYEKMQAELSGGALLGDVIGKRGAAPAAGGVVDFSNVKRSR